MPGACGFDWRGTPSVNSSIGVRRWRDVAWREGLGPVAQIRPRIRAGLSQTPDEVADRALDDPILPFVNV